MSAAPYISDEQIVPVIDRIANGSTLKAACADAGFHYGNILDRIRASERLTALDARAREDYQRVRVDEMEEIARTTKDVNRARLMCDNIKWEASRVARKIYGDRVDLTHASPTGGPVEFVVYGEREAKDADAWQQDNPPPV
jgi:hypothetical protein